MGLVSVSHHWNNFLWPLIVTNSVDTRPVTVGLSIFSAIDSGVEWSVINAATLMTSGPLLIAFLLSSGNLFKASCAQASSNPSVGHFQSDLKYLTK